MEDNNKLLIQRDIIKNLRQENEELRKINQELNFQLNFEKENHKNSLQSANDLILTCKNTKELYDESIKEASLLKEQYEASIKDINALKVQYKKEFNKLLKKISKT